MPIAFFIMGVFLILHAIVHLLYAGQSLHLFELRSGMLWPDEARLFAALADRQAVRWLAGGMLALCALAYFAGGVGLIAQQPWGTSLGFLAALLSSVTFVLFWDFRLQGLDDQGGVGVLINLAVAVALRLWFWPA